VGRRKGEEEGRDVKEKRIAGRRSKIKDETRKERGSQVKQNKERVGS
jgi:hypothetical protein